MRIDALKIETILANQRITKIELSKRSGVSRQNLSTIIYRGTCEPRTAGKIAEGLGVPVSDIIAKEG